MLGEFYYHGYGVAKNNDKAIHYYSVAAKRGITSAQYKAGLVYLIDEKHKNLDKAFRYMHQAARTKYKDATFLLGRMYLSNEFGRQNIEKADYYLAQAFGQYHQEIPATLAYLAQQYKQNFAELFPRLDKAYQKQPLEVKDGSLIWPNSDGIEVITVSGSNLESIFDIQLNSYRSPQKSLGSRLVGYSCETTVGCYQLNSMRELGDFLF